MTILYKIYMNDGEIINVPNDEPIDLDAIAKARWMEVKIPYSEGKTKEAYLNVAQITRIEVVKRDEDD